jgi:hypothetical protein
MLDRALMSYIICILAVYTQAPSQAYARHAFLTHCVRDRHSSTDIPIHILIPTIPLLPPRLRRTIILTLQRLRTAESTACVCLP